MQKLVFVIFFLAVVCLSANAAVQDPPRDRDSWTAHITSGASFVVAFDLVDGKFDDSSYTGSWQTDPMGTLKGGESYQVSYKNGRFTCSGYNQQKGRNITHISQGVRPEDGLISLWDRTYAFDGKGRVWDQHYGIVGHIRVGDKKTPTAATPEKQQFIDEKGNAVYIPCGEKAFADTLLEFNPGTPRPIASALKPREILGPNDYDKAADENYVTLGCGGSITIAFDKVNLIDVPGTDLYVFEIGSSVEPTGIEISKDGSKWINVGKAAGSTGAVDIHRYVKQGEKFRYLRLTDLKSSCENSRWPGADVDAVAAVGCVETDVGLVTPSQQRQSQLPKHTTPSTSWGSAQGN